MHLVDRQIFESIPQHKAIDIIMQVFDIESIRANQVWLILNHKGVCQLTPIPILGKPEKTRLSKIGISPCEIN